jgi:hypothetical protein
LRGECERDINAMVSGKDEDWRIIICEPMSKEKAGPKIVESNK